MLPELSFEKSILSVCVFTVISKYPNTPRRLLKPELAVNLSTCRTNMLQPAPTYSADYKGNMERLSCNRSLPRIALLSMRMLGKDGIRANARFVAGLIDLSKLQHPFYPAVAQLDLVHSHQLFVKMPNVQIKVLFLGASPAPFPVLTPQPVAGKAYLGASYSPRKPNSSYRSRIRRI